MPASSPPFDLVPFYCPVPPVLHPRTAQIEAAAFDWLERTGLAAGPEARQRMRDANGAEFYARITPDADLERIRPAVNWIYWGFGFDDVWCDAGPVSRDPGLFVARALYVLRMLQPLPPSPLAGDDPYPSALAEVAADFRRLASPTQYQRWVQALRSWLLGAAGQVALAASRTLPDLDSYLALRLASCGGEPTSAMIEIVTGLEVPARELDSPLVVAATESARMVAALDNDLVSGWKEASLGQTGLNALTVIAAQDGCTAATAAVRVSALRDRLMVLFLRLRERAETGASPELRSYLAGLANMVRGNLEWSARVPRYHRLPGQELAPAFPGWSERPSDSAAGPPPLPSLAWWWGQLA